MSTTKAFVLISVEKTEEVGSIDRTNVEIVVDAAATGSEPRVDKILTRCYY